MAKKLSNPSGMPQGLTKVSPRMKVSGSNFKQGKTTIKNGPGVGPAAGSGDMKFSPGKFSRETKGRNNATGTPKPLGKRRFLG